MLDDSSSGTKAGITQNHPAARFHSPEHFQKFTLSVAACSPLARTSSFPSKPASSSASTSACCGHTCADVQNQQPGVRSRLLWALSEWFHFQLDSWTCSWPWACAPCAGVLPGGPLAAPASKTKIRNQTYDSFTSFTRTGGLADVSI